MCHRGDSEYARIFKTDHAWQSYTESVVATAQLPVQASDIQGKNLSYFSIFCCYNKIDRQNIKIKEVNRTDISA